MKTIVKYLFLILAFAASHGILCAYEVRDARGEIFEFDSAPVCATIVPSVTQSIYALGAQDMLAGNSIYCTQPSAAREKTKIGSFLNPDYEKIAELKPQIFILPTLADNRIEKRLKSLGVKCFVLHAEGLENICKDIKMLGELFCRQKEAESVLRPIEFAMRPDAPCGKKAFFMFGNVAAGKGSYIDGIMNLCGLENCATPIGKPWAVPAREFVLSAQPDIVFVELPSESDRESLENFYKTDAVWRTTPAIKNGALFFMPREAIVIPSVRVVDAFALLRKAIKDADSSVAKNPPSKNSVPKN